MRIAYMNTVLSGWHHENSVREYCDIRVTSHENSVREYCDIRVSQIVINLTVVLESFNQMCRSTILPLKLWSLVTWTSNSSEFPYRTTWSQVEATHNYVRKQWLLTSVTEISEKCFGIRWREFTNISAANESSMFKMCILWIWSLLAIGLIPMCSQAHLGMRLP